MNQEREKIARNAQGQPACFGDPDRVCPRDEDGHMQPQLGCLTCALLKSCMQSALRRQGLIEDHSVVAPAVSKVSGFFKRWSDRKLGQSGGSEE